MNKKKPDNVYLVTGSAGFIGFHVSKALLERGETVIGFDSFNDYYSSTLKYARNHYLVCNYDKFTGLEGNITNLKDVKNLFCFYNPNYICHLAAYAGVPYSMQNPLIYEHNNGTGFIQLMEMARLWPIKNFVYASSSSVYGDVEDQTAIKEEMNTETPLSIYSATKKYNELLAHVYSKFYKIPITGLRFFTVYGPWGRPDMSMYKWVKALYDKQPLILNNFGNMWRDYTFVDDIVSGIIAALDTPQALKVYNLGRGEAVKILDVVDILQEHTGIKGEIETRELPDGEVLYTMADITKAKEELGYEPKTNVYEGTKKFVEWYRQFYLK